MDLRFSLVQTGSCFGNDSFSARVSERGQSHDLTDMLAHRANLHRFSRFGAGRFFCNSSFVLMSDRRYILNAYDFTAYGTVFFDRTRRCAGRTERFRLYGMRRLRKRLSFEDDAAPNAAYFRFALLDTSRSLCYNGFSRAVSERRKLFNAYSFAADGAPFCYRTARCAGRLYSAFNYRMFVRI